MLRLGDERFRVVGVLVPRGVSLGLDLDEVVLIPIGHHLRMFDRRSVFRVLCEARSARDVDAARRAILAVLRERHDGEEDVTVLTQDAVDEDVREDPRRSSRRRSRGSRRSRSRSPGSGS